MLPEERARVKIDKQLIGAGWDIVSRDEYIPRSASAVKEALMYGNTESDYLLFVDDKAIAVVEAKREENPLGEDVQKQAEDYACGLFPDRGRNPRLLHGHGIVDHGAPGEAPGAGNGTDLRSGGTSPREAAD